MAPTAEVLKARAVDPCRLADVTLATAVRAWCDAVFIEPAAEDPSIYVISFERNRELVTRLSVDAVTGAATIARLAYIAEIDLTAPHATSGVVPVRSGERTGEVVITARPGDGLRADLVVMPPYKQPRGPQPTSSTDRGSVIGNYRIVELLGEGGMGTVFRVEHVVLGRQYALKVLRAKVFARDRAASERFLREARAAARVRHANIVDVFDFGHLGDGRPYFVMELLKDESLADRIQCGPLRPQDVVAIARQIANALAAVHDHGVIHADVTPSNTLVVGEEPIQIKLVDFGLAAIVGEGYVDEKSEFVLGTPSYISPEQLCGLTPTDRSDQYGLGVVMFEMLVGHPPFDHPDLRKLCLMHIYDAVPPIESPHGPLPPKLADIVTTCLQKSPEARFPGMRALVAALDEIARVTDRDGWRQWLIS